MAKKNSNNCAETAPESNKKFTDTNTKVNENKRLEAILDEINNTLKDIKVLLDKKKPLSSEDL